MVARGNSRIDLSACVGSVRAVLLAAVVASVNVLGQTGSPAAASYAAPKTRLGQPDLQGIWQVLNTAAWDIQDHAAQRFPGLQARFSVPAGQESSRATRSLTSRGRCEQKEEELCEPTGR